MTRRRPPVWLPAIGSTLIAAGIVTDTTVLIVAGLAANLTWLVTTIRNRAVGGGRR